MELTTEKIEELKKAHNSKHLFILETEDGKTAVFKDCFSNFSVAKVLFVAIGKSNQEFAEAFIANLMVEGDEEFRTDPSIATGLADEMRDLLDMPEFKLTKKGDLHKISSEGAEVLVRPIERNDLVAADRKDRTKEPFSGAIALLDLVAQDKEWKQLQISNPRGLVGILSALEDLKQKKTVTVKKL